MELDNYQQAWRTQSSQTRVAIDADMLWKQVQLRQQEFRTTIFWRDFREVGIGCLMLPLWFFLGARLSLPWTWYLTIPALVWVIGFFLVDRMYHKQKRIGPGQSLLEGVTESLIELEHQIWLLRNVFWWYLLPFTISILAFFIHVFWLAWAQAPPQGWLETLIAVGAFLFLLAVVFAVYGFVYFLNQHAVRALLEPQRQELLTLLASLGDESMSEVSGQYPLLLSAKRVACSPRRAFIACLCFAAILLILIAGLMVFVSGHNHPERSPFSAVRWQEAQPEVRVGNEWFKLVSLDNLPAAEIVAFSQGTYGTKWQKRFEEDLVELLTQMGHPPQDSVKLVVQSLTSAETRTIQEAPMTRANRQAIRAAAANRKPTLGQ